MMLEQVKLDNKTQEMVKDALEHSGMNLADFIQQACRIYARTLIAKCRKRQETDLTTILTATLLNDAAYRTYPGRAEELTRRAIFAIMKHNNELAPDNDHRWCITQSAIVVLTGSRSKYVGNVLQKCQQMIDEHNQKYDLNWYSNRKGASRDIRNEIDLVKLVPDGLGASQICKN